jgi:hypothetical protein
VGVRAVRFICAAAAFVVCGWFALGARQAIDTQRATAIVSGKQHISLAQERAVSSLVRAARLLNPDKEPDILLAKAEVEHHDYARARRRLEAVVRSEPQNAEAWLWLVPAGGPDVLNAARHVRELEPRSPSS